MKKEKILNKVTGTVNKVGFKLKKHSPEILIAVGIVGTVVSAVMACKATTKVNDILEDAKKDLDSIHECSKNENFENAYSEQDMKKDITIVYAQTGVKLLKLYAPSVILGTLSLGSIVTSNSIQRKRNAALTAAYITIDKSFKDYRSKVIERFGDTIDRELRHGIKQIEVDETLVDENGEEKVSKEKVEVVEKNNKFPSDYARFFDETNPNWEKSSEYNLMFLRAQQSYANDILRSCGHIFLNDVYKMLGIPETKAGQIVGWIYNPDDETIDNYVDFGIYEINREKSRDFVNGYERSILLDFNVDGPILDDID